MRRVTYHHPRRHRTPAPLNRSLPALTLTFTPSLRVLHWRVMCRDLDEQERLVALVGRVLDALEAAA